MTASNPRPSRSTLRLLLSDKTHSESVTVLTPGAADAALLGTVLDDLSTLSHGTPVNWLLGNIAVVPRGADKDTTGTVLDMAEMLTRWFE